MFSFWIIKPSVQQAVLVAQISAELDEERGKSSALEISVADLQKTNEELCESQMSLQTKLVQRYLISN